MAESRGQRLEVREQRGVILSFLLSVLCLLSFSSCSDMEAPTARQALAHPFGTGAPFTLGTTKEEVLADWGPPDHKIQRGVDELGVVREEWIYRGRLQNLPIDYEYVSRTKHLVFEGNHLARWESDDPPEEKRKQE